MLFWIKKGVTLGIPAPLKKLKSASWFPSYWVW
jgi:hypothetical protein